MEEVGPAVLAVLVSVVGLGVIISRYTKTDKDDAFFEKVAKILGLKK